ncbi:MAG: type II toxin-antitoxin system HicA family toxin [Pseudomonadota bacterium]
MSKAEKILQQMRNNPKDWRIEDLETVAGRYGLDIRRHGGSHVIFSHPEVIQHVTVPAKNPVKPPYIRQFLAMLDLLI